jgi:hypothetical protein
LTDPNKECVEYDDSTLKLVRDDPGNRKRQIFSNRSLNTESTAANCTNGCRSASHAAIAD